MPAPCVWERSGTMDGMVVGVADIDFEDGGIELFIES